MEKRGSFSDDLALTKSAAWAWLEHLRPRQSPHFLQFNVSRTEFHANSSRYKAEALRKLQQKPAKSSQSKGYCSLLDGYEIERISRKLDYYIECSIARAEAEMEMKSNHQQKKAPPKGLWLGSHVPLACGSSRDAVVDARGNHYSRCRRRSLENRHVAAVEVVGCRPGRGIPA